ncbi:MAG: MarR family transcriptional regulator [Chloroflexota bacterium]|nr:MarR family transcriptional regulator [Chloroflexota bacterium]
MSSPHPPTPAPQHGAGETFDLQVGLFWSLLLQLVLDGEKRLSAVLHAHDLTPPQFYVLKTLTEHDGRCAIGQIARLHGLTNPTMSGLVKRLEALGLVARTMNADDRRSVYVTLTDAGSARYDAVSAELLAKLRDALALIPPDQRAELFTYLAKYAALIML